MNNFKIWLKVAKKTLNFRTVIIFFVGHLVTFLIIYFLFSYNFILSIVFLVLLMLVMSVVRLFLFYKKLFNTDSLDKILLKPIDPLFGLIVYNMNIADIVMLLPLFIFLKFKNKVQI